MASFSGGHGYTIAEHHPVRCEGRDTIPWNHDPREVEGIGGADAVQVSCGLRSANSPKPPHCLRKRELLAGHPSYKPPSPDLPPRLESSEHAKQLSPRWGTALPHEQPAEHDPVPAQKHPRVVI